ncbi:MAG: hypothetical protein K2X07_02015 [Caulobacteraceae bacterium]|nr:hypothetical protein [Caulobacteraceae bacterium]
MRFIAVAAVGAVSLAACATPQPPEEGGPNRPLAVDLVCPSGEGGLMIGLDPPVARQGADVNLTAFWFQGPHVPPTPVAIGCLRDLAVSPAGAATLSRDGRLRLAADAPSGEMLTVSARVLDAQASVSTRVVGRDEPVLTGTWRQDRIKCDPGREPGEPVRELKVTGDGRFNVTYQPFESYVDIWGALSFDPAAGTVALTPDGGNFDPPIFDGEGRARLDGERRLILDGVYLGDRNERNLEPRTDDKGQPVIDRPVCTYEFVR